MMNLLFRLMLALAVLALGVGAAPTTPKSTSIDTRIAELDRKLHRMAQVCARRAE